MRQSGQPASGQQEDALHMDEEPQTSSSGMSAEHRLLELLPSHVSHLKPELAGAVTMYLLLQAVDLLAEPNCLPRKVSEAILEMSSRAHSRRTSAPEHTGDMECPPIARHTSLPNQMKRPSGPGMPDSSSRQHTLADEPAAAAQLGSSPSMSGALDASYPAVRRPSLREIARSPVQALRSGVSFSARDAPTEHLFPQDRSEVPDGGSTYESERASAPSAFASSTASGTLDQSSRAKVTFEDHQVSTLGELQDNVRYAHQQQQQQTPSTFPNLAAGNPGSRIPTGSSSTANISSSSGSGSSDEEEDVGRAVAVAVRRRLQGFPLLGPALTQLILQEGMCSEQQLLRVAADGRPQALDEAGAAAIARAMALQQQLTEENKAQTRLLEIFDSPSLGSPRGYPMSGPVGLGNLVDLVPTGSGGHGPARSWSFPGMTQMRDVNGTHEEGPSLTLVPRCSVVSEEQLHRTALSQFAGFGSPIPSVGKATPSPSSTMSCTKMATGDHAERGGGDDVEPGPSNVNAAEARRAMTAGDAEAGEMVEVAAVEGVVLVNDAAGTDSVTQPDVNTVPEQSMITATKESMNTAGVAGGDLQQPTFEHQAGAGAVPDAEKEQSKSGCLFRAWFSCFNMR